MQLTFTMNPDPHHHLFEDSDTECESETETGRWSQYSMSLLECEIPDKNDDDDEWVESKPQPQPQPQPPIKRVRVSEWHLHKALHNFRLFLQKAWIMEVNPGSDFIIEKDLFFENIRSPTTNLTYKNHRSDVPRHIFNKMKATGEITEKNGMIIVNHIF